MPSSGDILGFVTIQDTQRDDGRHRAGGGTVEAVPDAGAAGPASDLQLGLFEVELVQGEGP
jgi:hypothetical protein